MKRLILSFALITLVVAGCGGNGITDQDRQFMAAAGSAGIMEVTIGQLAADKGSRPDVVAYGKQMVKEHTDFNNDFHIMLKKIGETVPDSMNDFDKKLVDSVKRAGQGNFDNTYIGVVYEDHKGAIEQFKKAITVAKNPDYLEFLKKGLVIVTHHFEMAEQLKKDSLPMPANAVKQQ